MLGSQDVVNNWWVGSIVSYLEAIDIGWDGSMLVLSSGHLNTILGQTEIKNPKCFVEFKLTLTSLLALMNKSLFTNIPVPQTLKIIESWLKKYETLSERANLPVNV